MSKYWSEITKNIEPYVCGEQPKDKKYIKLNTNENPYPPSPKVIEAIKMAANEDLRLYPDPNCDELRDTIAEYYDLNRDQVFIGNGSDEVLAFSFLAFFNTNEKIIFPDISYSFYPVYAKLYKLDYKLSSLKEDFSINVEDFLGENGGVVIPNPNAPTAKAIDSDDIKKILQHNSDKVVIIDEAYVDFGCESVVKLIKEYPNLLVIQTLSKSRCLAGIRVGFALGQEELIDGLNRIKNSMNSYTIDRVAAKAAVAAIKDEEYFKECVSKIINTRELVSEKLKSFGFEVIPSKANFIFTWHPDIDGEKLFATLRENGLLVRYFNKPRINNYLRITIGSEDEMNVFLEKLHKIVENILQK
ncbi:histidinol-phosphate aminotransferase [Clostridium pasteurianum DSM 525 = ATCC 6013]|uniref:Histidinol-phosphate aminotransferase n=1 Tax=Clostridium pasteurianum DSM 525 = ATCC 6013 TaxID=1262449 RepID=A0A0H3JB93_CLOPA|nr:histidinol-phosphate transaminase [Clostridium pasteurianum]AJA49330.1 histidinol-phosphate aminotransferase [Clostridium pasteurianum DSM 525 = ATCC 6013]AJA53318.1 histidinol-phosphate aminotransferase [Clostridium pasteurianum DSM 525 = ATCC 6013]AOZ76505.1 histidinol-phosphate aminotransferase [Clostridium pasteurianum DSM 525 = ATCC 6013]AOZ80302.1 histidinol-phosphate aminotransferase [Clostridium pasteurianum]ELP58350.1 histidinol-phosphate aminotransferase [Clostridium pasteurianum 